MIITAVVVVGLALGSFINALVWRMGNSHESGAGSQKPARSDEQPGGPKGDDDRPTSVWSGRSVCPDCGHMLSWRDLIPIVSWLGLGGKCRYCRRPISWHYPLVELVMATLFAVSVYAWDFSTELAWIGLGLWLAIVVCMVAIALYDISYYQIPMYIAYLMLLLGFALYGVNVIDSGEAISSAASRLMWQLLAATALIALPWAVSRGKWMGSGDIYLAALSGLVMSSVAASFAGVLVGFYLGALFTVPLMVMGKVSRRSKIPFGPFILSGVYGWFLWQQPLLRFIEQFLGL